MRELDRGTEDAQRPKVLSFRAVTTSMAIAFAIASTGCASVTEEDADDAQSTADSDSELQQSLRSETPDDDLDSFDRRAQWIDTYGAVPASCIGRVDPIDRTRALFHGCFDWHSSVHAHWALYRMDLAGAGRQGQLAARADARITDEGLDAVSADLSSSWFEMPYGRAWFLRLVLEHEAWHLAKTGRESLRMRPLGDRVAQSLVAAFASTPPNPRLGEHGNGAWPVVQLLAYARKTKNDELERVAMTYVRRPFVEAPISWAESTDSDPSAFLSSYWSAIYVIASAYDSATTLGIVSPETIPDEALEPVPDPGVAEDAHHLGINWSRAWAIKALARHVIAQKGKTDPLAKKLVKAYHAHVLAGRERHFRYRGNYAAYDHWVPQFAVYAITDDAGLAK